MYKSTECVNRDSYKIMNDCLRFQNVCLLINNYFHKFNIKINLVPNTITVTTIQRS